MKVAELMTSDVGVIYPEDSLRTAAQLMADVDACALPVCNDRRLVGMITERDIAMRGAEPGNDPDSTRVGDVMSEELRYCVEDEEAAEVSRKMGEWQVRKLPVLDRDRRLVGMVTLADLMQGDAPEEAETALKGMPNP